MNPPARRIIPSFFVYVLIWAVACTCGMYFRLFPLTRYVSFDAQEKATVFVLANLRKNIIASVKTQFPQLPPTEQERLIKQHFDETLHGDSQNARQTILRVGKEIDERFPPAERFPYLLESDPYDYYALTEKVLKEGSVGQIRGSKFYNPLMLAPEGHWEPFNLHPYVGVLFYRLIHPFVPEAPLRFALSFVPLFFTALSLIPFLIISLQLRTSPLSATVASIVFVLAPIFLKRSLFAWYDNDPYNIFFPLCILCLAFACMNNKHRRRNTILYAAGCAAAFSFYALFWHGWMYLLTVLLCSGGFIAVYNYFVLKDRAGTASLFLALAVVPTGTLAGIGILFGPKEFFVLFQEGLTALSGFLNPKLSVWPDLYIGVGELHRGTLSFLVEQTGGILVSVIAGVGIIAQTIRFVKEKSGRHLPFVVLIILLLSSFLLSLGAQRFVILYLMPVALFFLLGLDFLFRSVADIAGECEDKIPRLCLKLFVPVIAAALVVTPFFDLPKRFPAIMSLLYNDVWDRSLKAIAERSPADAIVNTWWPPGHFIKATAKRRVTFDGATINTPQAYWMANIFLSDDEQKALGILRMLNSSANKATEFLTEKKGMPTSQAVKLITAATALSRSRAGAYLKDSLSDEDAGKLLSLTHGEPPPSYLLIYSELVDKNIQLSFVGNWDFEKVEKINADPQRRQNIPPRKSFEYFRFLWTISGGEPKYSEILNQQELDDSVLLLEHHIRIDLKDMSCMIVSDKFGKGKPLSVLYLEDGQFKESPQPNPNLNYSVLLFREEGSYKCVLLDRKLGNSLLMRLFFLNGEGLKYFTPFVKEKDLTGRTQILVYKVEWKKFLKELAEDDKE